MLLIHKDTHPPFHVHTCLLCCVCAHMFLVALALVDLLRVPETVLNPCRARPVPPERQDSPVPLVLR